MRKINTRNYTLATRRTTRDVNSRIVLNLIREYQPISRADLARRMNLPRSAVSVLVRELVAIGEIDETAAETVVRGRRPTLLSIHTGGRLVLAIDVRPRTTFLALATLRGDIVARDAVETAGRTRELVDRIVDAAHRLAESYAPGRTLQQTCTAAGVVLPGMIDRKTGRLVYSPLLGWKNVDLRKDLRNRLGLKTFIESAPIACAHARLWITPEETRSVQSFAYVHVSDGIGVGLMANGEPVRGDTHSAGEFGHVRLSDSGRECSCGRRGCWEAQANNGATVARYLENAGAAAERDVAIDDVVLRGRRGDPAALAALRRTGELLGRGLAIVATTFNPGRIYVGGEITSAWDIIEPTLRRAMLADAITPAAGSVPVTPDPDPAEHRLKGAVALVNSPAYAAVPVG